MYIQYFWRNDFSGTGCKTSPGGVKGGGAWSFGLYKILDISSQKRWMNLGTYKGGESGFRRRIVEFKC